MSPFQQRVITESLELAEKLTKLTVFVNGEIFQTLPERDRELLLEQMEVMTSYVRILSERISRFAQ